jgi:hypothetical protein
MPTRIVLQAQHYLQLDPVGASVGYELEQGQSPHQGSLPAAPEWTLAKE